MNGGLCGGLCGGLNIGLNGWLNGGLYCRLYNRLCGGLNSGLCGESNSGLRSTSSRITGWSTNRPKLNPSNSRTSSSFCWVNISKILHQPCNPRSTSVPICNGIPKFVCTRLTCTVKWRCRFSCCSGLNGGLFGRLYG